MTLFFHKLQAVGSPLLITIASISLAKIHTSLAIVAITISIGYGIRKWYLMEKEHKKKLNNNKDETHGN